MVSAPASRYGVATNHALSQQFPSILIRGVKFSTPLNSGGACLSAAWLSCAVLIIGCSEPDVQPADSLRLQPMPLPQGIAAAPAGQLEISGHSLLRGGEDMGAALYGRVIRDGQGRYIAARTWTPGVLAVYDSTGIFLKGVGRSGSGPREFRTIDLLLASRDSLYLFDSGNARVAVLDGAFTVTRTLELRVRPSDLILRNDGYIAVYPFYDRDTAYTVHVLDHAAVPVRSMSPIPGGYDPRRAMYVQDRQIAADSAGIWVLHAHQYVLERYSFAGDLLAVVNQERDWFTPYQRPVTGAALPRMLDLELDASGRLWVLAMVPDPDWSDPPDWPATEPFTPAMMNRKYSSVIEVLNVADGRVIAAARLNRYLEGFTRAGELYGYREDAAGVPQVEVITLRVAR